MSSFQNIISLRGVEKIFDSPSGPFSALGGIDLDVREGEFVAVVGKSGSGKSTLVNILTGIDGPTRGRVAIAGTEIQALRQNALSKWRGKTAGIVFQFFQLLPTLTVAENVMLPMDFAGSVPFRERSARAMFLLDQMGISAQAHKLPSALSGGEQQRAAIARALANDPPIIAADEPTGNLDSRTSEVILKLFSLLQAEGKTIVMVTHERDLSRFVTREIALADGVIIADSACEQTGAASAKGGSHA